MRSSVKKRMIRIIAGLLMVCVLFPMLPAAAVEETEAVCTCGTVEGVHGEERALYEAPAEGETTPETTAPEVTEPETIEPEVTEPKTTEPETTEPEVTEPETTEPEVTEPKTTEPETAEPESTEPVLVVEDEHEAKKLNEGTPTMTVTFDGLELTEDGVVYNGWDYDVVKVLTVSLSGLTPYQEYKVALGLDKIMYFEPIPETPEDQTYTVAYTPNEGLPYMTKGGTESLYLHEGSGTAVYTFMPAGTELSFSVSLRYDVALWNRQENAELRWADTGNLLEVTLSSEGTELPAQKMTEATAGKRHKANFNKSDGTYGVRISVKGSDTRFHGDYYTQQTVKMRFEAFENDFYYENLVLDIELPSCTIGDTTYYMKIEKYAGQSIPYNIQYESIGEGKIRITVPHIFQNDTPIAYLLLTFPEELNDVAESGTQYTFKYKVTYNVNGDTFIPASHGEDVLTLMGGYGGNLKFVHAIDGYASLDWTEGGVAALGGTGLQNNGTTACEDVVEK